MEDRQATTEGGAAGAVRTAARRLSTETISILGVGVALAAVMFTALAGLRADLRALHDEGVQGRAEIRADMRGLEGRLRDDMAALETGLRREMAALETNLRREMDALAESLRAEMNLLAESLRSEMEGLRTDFGGLRADFGVLRTEMGELRVSMAKMQADQARMEEVTSQIGRRSVPDARRTAARAGDVGEDASP